MSSYYRFGREQFENEHDPLEMRRKAILFNWDEIGMLRKHSSEKLKHYLAKAIVMYELTKMKHRVVSEPEMAGVAKPDIFDFDTNTIYELENEPTMSVSQRRKAKYDSMGVDVVIVPIGKASDDIGELREHIIAYLRPD